MPKETFMTREEIATECKRLKAVINQSQSEHLRRDYDKRLKKLQKRLLYQDN